MTEPEQAVDDFLNEPKNAAFLARLKDITISTIEDALREYVTRIEALERKVRALEAALSSQDRGNIT